MKALIIGATGATGKDLVNTILADTDYKELVLFVRRPTGVVDAKLKEIITDFNKLEDVAGFITGDVWFSCLGTTLKAAGSKDNQWKIDYEIPAKFAAIAKRNGVSTTVLLSAYGASATSSVFYSKMKGKLEEYIDNLSFERYIIFKPGLLLRKNTDRFGERVASGTLKFLNGLGIARKFRPMPTSVLAEKMAKAPKSLSTGKHVIALEKIFS